MSKKLIHNCAALSIVTLIVGIIALVVSGMDTTVMASGASLSLVGSLNLINGLLCLIVCIIAGGISYFSALVKTASMRRMNWFVGILLFGVTGALVYGLAGPEARVSNEAMPLFLYRSYKQTKKTMGF